MRLLEQRVSKGCDPALVAEAVESDWPDIADALARSRVPILLFLGKDDPRYPLVLSFAERSGPHVVPIAAESHSTAAVAAGRELSRRILDFFETGRGLGVRLPASLWSRSWG